MKFVWKGKFNNINQLDPGNLPENAVKFKEPGSPLALNIIASLFLIPCLIILVLAVILKMQLFPNTQHNFINSIGIILAFLMIIPHEYLHAVVFPKDAEVQVWYYPKFLMAFVYSTTPTTKSRFIFLGLLPNLVFGFIPLIVWIFIPSTSSLATILFSFAATSIFMGCGDYLNIINASIQMPKGSITQLSGFHSYWYK